MPTPIENNTASLETVMGKINNVSSEVNTQATQIEEIMTLLEGKTYDSASLQPKVVTPTNEDQVIVADEGYQGLSQVTVKAASGAEIETCTLIIETSERGICDTLYYNTLDTNGKITAKGISEASCLIEVTCVCNSTIAIYFNYINTGGLSSTENVENLYGAIYKIIAPSGGQAIITNFVASEDEGGEPQ